MMTVTQQINHSDFQYVWTYIRYGCFFIDYFQLVSNDQFENCSIKKCINFILQQQQKIFLIYKIFNVSSHYMNDMLSP